MVAWRHFAGDTSIRDFTSTGNAMAFCRGTSACIALNRGNSTWTAQLHSSLPPGEYCNVFKSDTNDCLRLQVHGDGSVSVEVAAMEAVALHIGAFRPATAKSTASDVS